MANGYLLIWHFPALEFLKDQIEDTKSQKVLLNFYFSWLILYLKKNNLLFW